MPEPRTVPAVPARPRRTVARTRPSALLATLLGLVALLAPLAGTTAAHAAEGYRYWNYSHAVDGSWEFADTGLAQYRPEDGAVEGLRYGTSTVQQGIAPRVDPATVTFADVCTDPAPAEGEKRVALVIDYGTADDADGADAPEPRAVCASGPARASTQELLATVADLRLGDGFVCAVDGHPASGCGEPVPDATVPSAEPTVDVALPAPPSDRDGDEAVGDETQEAGDGGATWLLVGIGVLAAALAAGAVALSRRRSA